MDNFSKPTKAATKGNKQIYLENKSTIRFYTLMSSVSLLTNLILSMVFWPSSITWSYFALTFFSFIVYAASLIFMKQMASSKFNERGAVVDAGLDLNIQSGVSEYIKDLIILTSACQLLALISIYFWNLWLLVPIRAFYMLWVNVIGPWIFAPAPEEVEENGQDVNDKKQRKLLRKQQRGLRG